MLVALSVRSASEKMHKNTRIMKQWRHREPCLSPDIFLDPSSWHTLLKQQTVGHKGHHLFYHDFLVCLV